MENECVICGNEGTAGKPVLSLHELRVNVDGFHDEIRMCQTCLDRRAVARWNMNGAEGQRLADRLDAQAETPHGRYVYVEEHHKIHLVRLRPEWFASHSATITS